MTARHDLYKYPRAVGWCCASHVHAAAKGPAKTHLVARTGGGAVRRRPDRRCLCVRFSGDLAGANSLGRYLPKICPLT